MARKQLEHQEGQSPLSEQTWRKLSLGAGSWTREREGMRNVPEALLLCLWASGRYVLQERRQYMAVLVAI